MLNKISPKQNKPEHGILVCYHTVLCGSEIELYNYVIISKVATRKCTLLYCEDLSRKSTQ